MGAPRNSSSSTSGDSTPDALPRLLWIPWTPPSTLWVSQRVRRRDVQVVATPDLERRLLEEEREAHRQQDLSQRRGSQGPREVALRMSILPIDLGNRRGRPRVPARRGEASWRIVSRVRRPYPTRPRRGRHQPSLTGRGLARDGLRLPVEHRLMICLAAGMPLVTRSRSAFSVRVYEPSAPWLSGPRVASSRPASRCEPRVQSAHLVVETD